MSAEGSLFDVPPAAIGRFRVLHQVGAGASGPVFRGVHPDDGRALVIKLFTPTLTPDRLVAVAAELESLVAAVPTGTAACEIVAAGLHGNLPYLVSTFAPGDSLDVALKQFGPAALADLLPRLRAIAGALDAAAERGILHGALHPRDVLVSEDATHLTGLGAWPILARHGERLPVRRPYRAPELTEGAVSAAGDRFALAAMAHEWLTSRRVPSAFVAGDVAALPGVDQDALGQVFARALHVDPAERHESCSAFTEALAVVPAENADHPVPPARLGSESRPRRRGGRAATSSMPLPLATGESDDTVPAVAPTQEDAVNSDSVVRGRDEEPEPVATAASWAPVAGPASLQTGSPLPPVDISLRADTPDANAPAHAHAALGMPMRDFRDGGDAAPPRASRGWFVVAGLLVGLAAGLGAGYAFWGRGAGHDVGAAAPATEGAERPDTALPRQESPAVTPATGAAEGTAAPVAPAEPDPPRPEPSAVAASLLVRSTPAGATVFVDSQRRGLTPLALQDVGFGTRRVRIERDGFTPVERQVTLTERRPSRAVDVRLDRVPAERAAGRGSPKASVRTGSLLIESRPTGARVVLNGRQAGTTPMTIDDLEPGTYTVELRLATFRPVTTTVRVVAGERTRAAASLVSAQEP